MSIDAYEYNSTGGAANGFCPRAPIRRPCRRRKTIAKSPSETRAVLNRLRGLARRHLFDGDYWWHVDAKTEFRLRLSIEREEPMNEPDVNRRTDGYTARQPYGRTDRRMDGETDVLTDGRSMSKLEQIRCRQRRHRVHRVPPCRLFHAVAPTPKNCYPLVRQTVCLPAWPSVCLPACLSACLSVCPSVCPLSVCTVAFIRSRIKGGQFQFSNWNTVRVVMSRFK